MINIKLTDISDTGYNFTKNLPMGLNIASLLFFIFFSVAPGCEATTYFFPFYPGSEVTTTIERDSLGLEVAISPTGLGVSISDINLLEFTQIEVLGHFLYTYASIFLIILSLILLLAMLAIIIITKKNITKI
jgi:NADH-ubiquinone oxidoreductase chain 6